MIFKKTTFECDGKLVRLIDRDILIAKYLTAGIPPLALLRFFNLKSTNSINRVIVKICKALGVAHRITFVAYFCFSVELMKLDLESLVEESDRFYDQLIKKDLR